MSILLDTGAWFGKLHERDEHHEEAQAIVAACLDGVHGRVLTTSDIVDETFSLVLHRAGQAGWPMARDLGGLTGFSDERPTIASVIEIDRSIQEEAWGLFRRHYDQQGLSFTDCTSIVTVRREGIDAIASFDDGFDGLVERVAE